MVLLVALVFIGVGVGMIFDRIDVGGALGRACWLWRILALRGGPALTRMLCYVLVCLF